MIDLDELPKNNKITIQRFAELCGVSYRTIKRYIDKGKLLPRHSLGGKPYFLLGDVETFRSHSSSEPLILDGAPIYGQELSESDI
jgi:hypothetical protein